MADNVIDVTGKARWAKVSEVIFDKGSSKEEGAKYDYAPACTIEVILDQSELKEVKAKNPDCKPGVTDDGLSVKFRRTLVNATNAAWGGPPVVVDADGEPWPPEKRIGDDSTVRVAAEVYDTKFGKRMRLMKVMVLEYVEPEMEDEPELPF